MSQQAGKAVSKWTAKIGDLIVGGQPSTFNDIGGYFGTPLSSSVNPEDHCVAGALVFGDREKLQYFTDVLFEDNVCRRWSPKVRELLVMALLLRYEQFLDVLRDASHLEAFIPGCTFKSYDPKDKRHDLKKSEDFFSIQNHLFVCRVERALEKAGVDKLIFNKWISCARNAFLSRNIPGISDQEVLLIRRRKRKRHLHGPEMLC
mgnify:CR=1 FL=1